MKAALERPEIVLRNGKPSAVILDIDTYKEMLERIEDAEDLAWLRNARRQPPRFRKLTDFLKEHPVRA